MPKLNKKIFKSYDIRGVYPDDLTPETAYTVGQAYAQLTKAKRVAVGRDMRLGSPELMAQLVAGLISQGVQVDELGLVPIDAIYFAVGKYKYDGGIMITASHNPKEYNGIKMAKRGNGIEFVRGKELYEFIQDNELKEGDSPGMAQSRDIMTEYIDHVMTFADINTIKPFKIVVDAGNGMAGKTMPLIFEKIPCQLIPMNFELDGNFPAHPSNPLLPESQAGITKKVVEEKADFGVILDGDTDRLFFITEKGEFVRADTTLLVLAKYFLEHHKGAGIAYNVICSRAVPERIKEWGGRPLRSPVGFVNVAQAMKDNDGIMGGELSAHYSFRDNYYADSGFIAFIILLMLISEYNQPLSQIIDGLNPYAKGDEINISINNIPEVIAKVKAKFDDGQQDEMDGITVAYDKWWFNVRPSNTEPLLRITLEAENKKLLAEKRDEVVSYIKSIAT